MKLNNAVSILVETLKNDNDYYHAWQANIAMAFGDEIKRYRYQGDVDIVPNNSFAIHDMCNDAAKRFLHILCMNYDPNIPQDLNPNP